MARIFISYRREDSDIWVLRLVDELRKHFPPEQVFQDIASIDPGADFVEALDKALSTAAVMLAVIGQRWLSATDKQGRRRLDMPGDFVRQEIAESLRRPGVRVFPLLVNGAEMPAEEDLPEPLKALHRRHGFELTVRHWNHDVAQLVQTLKRAPGFSDDRRADADFTRPGAEQAAQRREGEERATGGTSVKEAGVPPSKFGWMEVAAIGAIVGAVALVVFFSGGERHEPPAAPAAPAPAPTVEPAAKSTPREVHRIVINGPKPLYAPYKTGDVFQECADCPEMVVIIPDPNGFTIGTPESQAMWGSHADENPFGPIRFAKPYTIGKFEITRAQFKSSGVQLGAGCHVWDGKRFSGTRSATGSGRVSSRAPTIPSCA